MDDLPSREAELGQELDEYTAEPCTEYQRLMRGNCMVLSNHVATAHKQFVKDTIALVPEGGNWKDLPKGVGESRKFHEAWTRYDGNKPSRTIDTGHRHHFHYKYNRVPTVRECARLQGFSDTFVIPVSDCQAYKQFGNAVTVNVSRAVAEAVRESLQNLGEWND